MQISWKKDGEEEQVKSIYKTITTIGSDQNADVVLIGQEIPPCAAHIHRQGEQHYLNLLESYEEARRENRPIRSAIKINQPFRIGNFEMVLFSENKDLPVQAKSEPDLNMEAYKKFLNFSKKLMTTQDFNELLEELLDETIALCKGEKGFIVLSSKSGNTISVARSAQKRNVNVSEELLSDSILEKALSEMKPILVHDAKCDEDFKSSKSVVDLRLSSVMCVPLMTQGKSLGALYIGNNSVVHAFAEKDLEILSLFASQASLILSYALQINALRSETKVLKESLEESQFGKLIGSCRNVQKVFQAIRNVSTSEIGVLISGESGTGKELIAREIHSRSSRIGGPFITINCGAMAPEDLEIELFGCSRSAAPMGTKSRIGRFQAADLGTLFLNEICATPLNLQSKILRAITDNKITRKGELSSTPVDVRVLTSTSKDVRKLLADKLFLEELYYQLNIVEIQVPPLRERGNDILIIARYFVKKYGKSFHKDNLALSKCAEAAISAFNWPGNVRQLENRIKRAVVLCENNCINATDLDLNHEGSNEAPMTLASALDDFRNGYINKSLARNSNNRTKTARELGVDPRTVFRHLEEQRRRESHYA